MQNSQDVFVEQLVARRKGAREYLLIASYIGLFISLILLILAFLNYILPFAFILFVAACWALWYFISNLNQEFEYICTNGTIDIDIIINKRKRKRKISMTARNMEIMTKLDDKELERYFSNNKIKKMDLTTNTDRDNVWCFVGTYKENKYLVAFEPNERILKDLKRFNPSKIKYNMIQA